jgi:PAS domain S-box-containing protein
MWTTVPTRSTKLSATVLRAEPTQDVDALFRAVADEAPVMLWSCDETGEYTFVNRFWLEFTGRTLEQELGCGWIENLHPNDREAFIAHTRRAIRAVEPFTYEYRLRRADGQYRRVLAHGAPRFAPDGALHAYVGTSADITDRREPDTAVRLAQHRFQELVDNAQDMVYRLRVAPSLHVEFIGGAAERITGHSPEEFYADPTLARACVHRDDVHLIDEMLTDPSQAKNAATLRWVHPDGRIVWAEHRRVPVLDATGHLLAIEGIARDVTSRVHAQQRLRESEEQMRQLAARIQSAREEERANLARELHDELGQTLTAIKLELARATAEMRRERISPTIVDRLQSLVGLTDIGITTVKRITTNLRPATLDHLGLATAIRWEAMTFRARTGIRCHLRAEKETSRLEPEQQTMVFRIFQEALTNIVRHAKASAVHVSLTERNRLFQMRIRDNGVGISEPQAANPRAIGLLGMRERAALVGGTFGIQGRRGKGTVVTVEVPIPAPAPRSRAR